MRDRGIWREAGYCPCGRPLAGVEVASISRLDDMKKVKGVNIWPQAVDGVLFADPLLDDYQVVLTSDRHEADFATVKAMPKRSLSTAEAENWPKELAARLRERIGIQFAIEVLPPGSLARSEYKAKRWIDERSHAQRH
jgi:phenylacetate-CoA ligase